MKITYYAVVGNKSGASYPVMVPDIPGCYTEGRTLDEARRMAEDAVQAMLSDYAARGERYPEASATPEELRRKVGDEWVDVACLVPVTVYPNSRVIRISLTGGADKLERIKDFAERHGTTRSAFMVDSALAAMARAER